MNEKMENLMLAIDELVNIADDTAEVMCKLIDSIPGYLLREMVHPRKKPRGSIRRERRARRGGKNE